MRIRVTQQHIANGERCVSQRCMISLAVRDAYPGATIRTDYAGVWVNGANFVMDDAIRQRLQAFDLNRTLAPFCFTLKDGKATFLA